MFRTKPLAAITIDDVLAFVPPDQREAMKGNPVFTTEVEKAFKGEGWTKIRDAAIEWIAEEATRVALKAQLGKAKITPEPAASPKPEAKGDGSGQKAD